MGRVGLDDVNGARREDVLKVPAGEEPLAERDRSRCVSHGVKQPVQVLAQHWLFDEHELVGFELLDEDLCHGLVHTPVEVDADVDIRAYCLPHGGDVGDGALDLLPGVDVLHLFGAVHLYRGEAALHCGLSGRSGFGGAVAAYP